MSDHVRSIAMALTLAAALVAAQPGAAAQIGTPAPAAHDDSVPDDIVVSGYRDRIDRDKRVRPPAAQPTTRNRRTYEYSERIAKCAARSRLSDLSRLRAVVDGSFGSPSHYVAQDRLVHTYIACSESAALLSFTSEPAEQNFNTALAIGGDTRNYIGVTGAAPLGRSIYDRGAFTIQALKMFAPDLRLTERDTGDPAVQARFNAREVPLNRLRLPADYRYFEVAVCMVRLQPRLAVRLAMSDGGARLGDVQEALIDRARACVGGVAHVEVDPTQFRLYIADAVYRWAVAARGVETLIPDAPPARG